MFRHTTETYRQGARTLPRECYTSPTLFAEELARIHSRQWNCVGRSAALDRPADFITREIAGESLIVTRDDHNTPRAFFNVCRHRGTRLCAAESGHFSGGIRCPYHAWTYGTDGRLLGAPHMQEVEGFDRTDYPLHQAAVAEWEGFLFVNIAREPEPFETWFAPLLDRFRRFNLASLVVRHHVRYEVRANWKLVFQNYSECLHCPMIHPELSTVLPFQSGANDLSAGPFLGGFMELAPPSESATLSGRSCGALLSENMADSDRKRAWYYAIMPNLLLSIHPDYVNYYLVRPVSVDNTVVESEWMFRVEEGAGAPHNPGDAIEFWDITNRQDWRIVELSQLGVSSSRYSPGPYSPRESIPAAWDAEYLRLMAR